MADVEGENVASFDFGKKKKKTKKKTEETTEVAEGKKEEQPADSKSENKQEEQAKGEDKDEAVPVQQLYTYEELAQRIFNLISSSRPEEKTVYKMKPPVVYREGTKKTVWVNFPEICKM